MSTRVLIIDDHSVVRQGLKTFLGLDPEIQVVGAAVNGKEGLRMAHELGPQVVLLDLLMPEMDGYATLAAFHQELPGIRVLVLTCVLEESAISRALKAGASGYLLKNMQAPELCRTIKAAASGPLLISPEAGQLLANRSDFNRFTSALSEREIEVLKLLAIGKANKEIAQQLKLSEGTVKTHVSIVLAKLGLNSRTQAAIYATNLGLVPGFENFNSQPA